MKLALGLTTALAVVLLAAVGGLTYQITRKLTERQRWVVHTHEVRERILELMVDISNAESGRRGYVLTGDVAHLRPQIALKNRCGAAIQNLRSLVSDNPPQVRRLDLIATYLRQKLIAQDQSILLHRAVPRDMQSQISLTRRGAELGGAIQNQFRAMVVSEDALLRKRNHLLAQATRTLVWIAVVGAIVSIALLSAVIRLLYKQTAIRERSQAELRTKTNILESVLSSMSDGVVVADADGRLVHANAAADRLTGLHPIGMDLFSWSGSHTLLQQDGRTPYPAERLPLARALQGEVVAGEPMCVRHRDGLSWIEAAASPLTSPDGRNAGGVVVLRDMTERRSAEDEIARLNQSLRHQLSALEATNRELESFSYAVSHDLRSPLRAIDGFSAAIEEDYADGLDGQAWDYLRRIRLATQRMGRLIDDMLVLSRVTRQEMAPEPLDLSAKAAGIVDELRSADPSREVDVVIAPGIRANGDRHLIRAALDNLLGNAWKFTSKRTGARIEFGLSITDAGERAVFVRDNGAGFDPRYSHKLFGPFQRLHASDEFPGTGIGLATVQRIAARHGGRVWADGAVGQGATFYMSLDGLEGPVSPVSPVSDARAEAGGPDGNHIPDHSDSARGRQPG